MWWKTLFKRYSPNTLILTILMSHNCVMARKKNKTIRSYHSKTRVQSSDLQLGVMQVNIP